MVLFQRKQSLNHEKLFLALSLLSLVSGSYAQGQINLSNGSNSGTGPTATTGGLFWINDLTNSPTTLINTDFNVSFYGGSDPSNLVLLKTFVNSGGGAAVGPGTFLDLSGQPISIPGALTSAFFRIEAWMGGNIIETATWRGASGIFSNPLGNPLAQPPGIPTDFTGMPAIILIPLIPEPSTFALAGIGAVALLIFHRRNISLP